MQSAESSSAFIYNHKVANNHARQNAIGFHELTNTCYSSIKSMKLCTCHAATFQCGRCETTSNATTQCVTSYEIINTPLTFWREIRYVVTMACRGWWGMGATWIYWFYPPTLEVSLHGHDAEMWGCSLPKEILSTSMWECHSCNELSLYTPNDGT